MHSSDCWLFNQDFQEKPEDRLFTTLASENGSHQLAKRDDLAHLHLCNSFLHPSSSVIYRKALPDARLHMTHQANFPTSF